jgi:AbrB family looped-hinge helix DNA binding protein
MVTATMTSKGQLTVPKAIRDRLGLAPGDKVEFVEGDGGGDRVVLRKRRVVSVRELFKALPKGAVPSGQEATDDAIAAQVLDEGRRSRG